MSRIKTPRLFGRLLFIHGSFARRVRIESLGRRHTLTVNTLVDEADCSIQDGDVSLLDAITNGLQRSPSHTTSGESLMCNKLFVLFLVACFCCNCGRARSFTADLVLVRNAGNLPDSTGQGAVNSDYFISATEVTNAQYVKFLNAVDPDGLNDLRLYNVGMTTDSGRGGITFNPLAAAGSRYAVKPGRNDWPINYVAWWDAIRLVNWLHNGRESGDTETGAYDLGPLNLESEPINSGAGVSRNLDATWFLPTDNQWYKAAFHKNHGETGNYWDYHYGSDSQPTAEMPPGGTNSANFSFAVGTLTEVGSYFESTSPYGTFDQSGNVEEWTETLIPTQVTARRLANGSWRTGPGSALGAFQTANASSEQDEIGFRIARAVPEPTAMALFIAAMGVSHRRSIVRRR